MAAQITLSLGLRWVHQVAVHLEQREVHSLMILFQVPLHTHLGSHQNSVKAAMIAPLIILGGGLIPSDPKTVDSSLRKVVFPGLTP